MGEIATLGRDHEIDVAICASEADVEDALKTFVPDIISMGARVRDVQARALAGAPFMKETSGERFPSLVLSEREARARI